MGGQSGSWTPTKRRGPIAAEFQGPGPAAIGLPSLFGNINIKESSKARAPAYTFGNRHERKLESASPAPNAYNTSRLNPRGKDEPKAPTLHIKPKEPKSFVTPSPGAYNPDAADKDVKISAPKYSFGIKTKSGKPKEVPAPNAYSIAKPSFDQAPQHAFGIKHSPYLGNLKGDAWVPARTEVMVSPPTTNGNYSNSDTKTIKTVVDKGNVTSTSRTHSDGHKIRTETFTYTKGPTIRTSTTTTTSHQIAA